MYDKGREDKSMNYTLIQICQIMKNKDISSVIVMNESKTHIGIITERYVVYKIAQEDVTLLLQA